MTLQLLLSKYVDIRGNEIKYEQGNEVLIPIGAALSFIDNCAEHDVAIRAFQAYTYPHFNPEGNPLIKPFGDEYIFNYGKYFELLRLEPTWNNYMIASKEQPATMAKKLVEILTNFPVVASDTDGHKLHFMIRLDLIDEENYE